MNRKRSEKQKSPIFLAIGYIAKTHSLRGEVILSPYQAVHGEITSFTHMWVVSSAGSQRLKIEKARPHKKRFIVKFKGIDRIEDCSHLKGEELFIEMNLLAEDTAKSLFIQQTDGIRVIDEKGRKIGILECVLETPAHPVLVIITEAGGELMIPSVDEFIKEVDIEKKTIILKPPKGIFEIYDI